MIRPRITINCRLINKVSLGNCLARHTQLSLHYIIRITVHAISKYYSMLLSRLITEEIFRDRMESSPIINVTGPCQESTSLPPIVYCISIKRGREGKAERMVCPRDSRKLYRDSTFKSTLSE